ncbi:MAG: hypothetical protein RI575_05845 [Balneolaceae bacterium]|nr:hypothetical protein [Balneolaceae bacterium]MDR9408745.1 hypothetical protein [Balneolaceae bacterium]
MIKNKSDQLYEELREVQIHQLIKLIKEILSELEDKLNCNIHFKKTGAQRKTRRIIKTLPSLLYNYIFTLCLLAVEISKTGRPTVVVYTKFSVENLEIIIDFYNCKMPEVSCLTITKLIKIYSLEPELKESLKHLERVFITRNNVIKINKSKTNLSFSARIPQL